VQSLAPTEVLISLRAAGVGIWDARIPNGIEPPAHREGIDVIAYDAVSGPHELDGLARAFTDAHLRMSIAAEYSLAHAADAHRLLERGHVLGRIGLRIRR
jgi:hypothetical protein